MGETLPARLGVGSPAFTPPSGAALANRHEGVSLRLKFKAILGALPSVRLARPLELALERPRCLVVEDAMWMGDEDVQPVMREALSLAVEELAETRSELPSQLGTLIMAFSIADAIHCGELDADRLAGIAVRAIDETPVH